MTTTNAYTTPLPTVVVPTDPTTPTALPQASVSIPVSSTSLAFTGTDVFTSLGVGGALVLAGIVAVVKGRRA
jgi:hypothetical protein